MDNIDVQIDARATIKNLERFAEANKGEAKRIVGNTASAIARNMKSIVRGHTRTGNLLRSISNKQTRPREFRPIPKEYRGLFRSVHPRNSKGGSHSHLLDQGTGIRSTARPVGRFRTNRGQVSGINFRQRARDAAASNFKSNVSRMVNRNETV